MTSCKKKAKLELLIIFAAAILIALGAVVAARNRYAAAEEPTQKSADRISDSSAGAPDNAPQLVKLSDDDVAEVIVSQPNGFASGVELVVTEIEHDMYGDYSDVAENANGKVEFVYDVTLKLNGVAIQPDGVLTVKLRIPEKLTDKPFTLFHLHDGEAVEKKHTLDGEYAVVTTVRLSEFIFVGEKENAGSPKNNNVWIMLITILSVIIACEIAFIVYRTVKTKKKGGK